MTSAVFVGTEIYLLKIVNAAKEVRELVSDFQDHNSQFHTILKAPGKNIL